MSASPASSLASGFADAVIDSQLVFRAVMRAMAEPGRIETLTLRLAPPAPITPATAGVVLALCDADTRLWLSPAMATPAASGYLGFHSDARLAAAPGEAAFAVVEAPELALGLFDVGTPAYPDRGATVIVQCPSLTDGPRLTLAGPGIAAAAAFASAGLPADFVAQLRANRARFPLGVDLIFTAGNQLAALPRSTRILAEER